MSDQYETWRLLLAGAKPLISDAEPAVGFYRVHRKGAPWEPVAIAAQDDGTVYALRGPDVVAVETVWPWAARNPVEYDAYISAFEGRGWPDDAPALPVAAVAPPADAAENPRAVAGDNAATTDAAEALRLELEGEKEIARQFLASPITSQEEADRAAVWASRVAELKNRGDAAHKAEKAPHLEAGRKVDDRFRWREEAEILVKKLKNHVLPWLQQKKAEEDARARAAAEEARKQREEAQRLADEAAKAGDAEAAERAIEAQRQADEAAKAAQPQRASAGRTGARVSVRTTQDVTVSDPVACAAHFAGLPQVPNELLDVLRILARRSVSNGHRDIPGVTISSKQSAA